MKVLKIIGISIAVMVILIIGGVTVFLSTFDLNKYLNPIKEQASKALGRSVTIDRAKMDFNIFKGINVAVSGITIADDPAFNAQPFCRLENAHVAIDTMAFITRREIVISGVDLSGLILNIIKDAKGALNAQTIGTQTATPTTPSNLPVAKESSSDASSTASTLPALVVKKIHLSSGTINFTDHNQAMPLAIALNQVDVVITDFALDKAFDLAITMALLSREPNVTTTARIQMDLIKQGVLVSNLKSVINLASIDLDALKKVSLILKDAPLPTQIAGQVVLTLPTLKASAKGLDGLSLNLNLTDGLIKLKELYQPLSAINLEIAGDLERLSIKNFTAHLGKGEITATSYVKNMLTEPSYALDFVAKGLQTQELIDPAIVPVSVITRLDSDGKISGISFDPASAMLNLKGEINTTVGEGKIEKINIAEAILNKLGGVPVIGPVLSEILKNGLNKSLNSDTTVLKSGLIKILINNGDAVIDTFNIISEPVTLEASGTFNLIRMELDAPVIATLSDEVSKDLIDNAKSLQGLANDKGMIIIPGRARGTVPTISYNPDINDIVKKVSINEVSENVGKQLDKVFEKNPEVRGILNAVLGGGNGTDSQEQIDTNQQIQSNQEQPAQEPSGEDLLNNIFNKVLK